MRYHPSHWIGFVLVLVLIGACDSRADTAADGVSEASQEDPCQGLSQAECASAEECEDISGWPMPAACMVWMDQPGGGAPQFVECQQWQTCTGAFVWTSHPDGTAWLFPSGCLPEGWSGTGATGTPDCSDVVE